VDALRKRIEIQKGYQMGREEDDLHDHYVEFFTEALDWVLEQIDALECAEKKAAHDGELTEAQEVIREHIQCATCED
jgi:hypothetical protein